MTDASPHRRLRRVYLLPNLFTASNLAFGVLAIFNVMDGDIKGACWWVVLAAVLDACDGMVARMTHTESEFGLQFDSLSDLASFGVAPAVIALAVIKNVPDIGTDLATAACLLFAVLGAVRLARYNVQAKSTERKGFVGLPIPGGAMCLVLPVMTMIEHNLIQSKVLIGLYPFLILGVSLLMVSEVPYASLVKILRPERRMSFETLVSLLMVLVLVGSLASRLRVTIFCILGYGYVFYGLASWVFHRFLQQQRTAR